MRAFDWKRYFILAQELLEKEDEAYLRSSVIRAYYSLFNILLQKIGGLRGGFDKHKKLIQSFEELDLKVTNSLDYLEDEELIKIGSDLKFLRNQRNKADYDNAPPISKRDAQEVYEKVKIIFEMIESL